MHKIVFFDIDGTLWDESMKLQQSVIKALKSLKQNGHKMFLCTGRSRASITSEELLGVGFDGIVAACGCYIELNRNIIFERTIEPAMINKIIDIRKRYNMPVVFEGSVDYWIDETGFEQDPYVDYLLDSMGEHAHIIKEGECEISANKFSADIISGTNIQKIEEALSSDFNVLYHVDNTVEFVPIGYSKATGIRWLCDYLGVDIGNTYAIGDSVNDIEMLKTVGHGIAMGNATDEVKRIAEFITTDIHADGIKNALLHYGLI